MLKAVLFDLFDTLVPRSPTLPEMAGAPLEIGPTFESVWNAWGHRRMTAHVPYRDLLEEAFQEAGVRPREGRLDELCRARADEKAIQLSSIVAEILEMIQECRNRGLRTAVVSGCAMDDVTAWAHSPLAPMMDATAFSFDVGANKPDPRIHLEALKRLGVSPAEAAFVDDSPTSLEGARAVGIGPVFVAAWFVDRQAKEARYTSEFPVIRSTSDLVTALPAPPKKSPSG